MSVRSRISSFSHVSLSFQKFFTRTACLVKRRMAMLDGVPRTLGRPLTASLASATRRATLAGRSTPCLASTAMRYRSHDGCVSRGWCSAEQPASQVLSDAWKRMEGRRMERGTAGRVVGGPFCKHGRVCEGRCGRLELRLYSVAGERRSARSGHLEPCGDLGMRV